MRGLKPTLFVEDNHVYVVAVKRIYVGRIQ
jgi:hypothetical protein